jgi:hypothetical protein
MTFVNLEYVIFTGLTPGELHVFVSIYVINPKYRTEELNNDDFFGARTKLNSTVILYIPIASCPFILEANRINPSKRRHNMTSLIPWCHA